MKPNPHRSRLRFEGFELDPVSGELTRDHEVVRLQPQPCKVLIHLAHRPGQVVSRRELYRVLWGDGTHVDAERGLNFCIKELRKTLDDDARAPRFIETLPRRGYRFVAEVEAVPVSPPLLPVASRENAPATESPRRWRRWGGLAAAGVVGLLAAWGWFSSATGPATPVPSDGMTEIDAASAAYLEGRYLAARGTPEALEQSLRSFQQAIAEDPSYALAWVALSEVQLGRARNREIELPATLDHAIEAARRAVDLDPESSAAHLALSRAQLYRNLDWRGAESAVDRALALDATNAAAHSHRAFLLAGQGRHEEALTAADAARRLDPERPAFQLDMGWYHYLARDYDAAVEACERALELEPGFAPALDCLESAHAAAGRFSQALGVEKRSLRGDPADNRAAESRWQTARHSEITALEQANTQSRCAAVPLAVELAGVGDLDGAFARLDDAFDGRSSWLPLVAVEPRLDPLRGDPRWADLMARLGLEPSDPGQVSSR